MVNLPSAASVFRLRFTSGCRRKPSNELWGRRVQSQKGLVAALYSNSKCMRFYGQRNGLIFRLLWSHAVGETIQTSPDGEQLLVSAFSASVRTSADYLQVAGGKGDMRPGFL
jgi:hypothetical protein